METLVLVLSLRLWTITCSSNTLFLYIKSNVEAWIIFVHKYFLFCIVHCLLRIRHSIWNVHIWAFIASYHLFILWIFFLFVYLHSQRLDNSLIFICVNPTLWLHRFPVRWIRKHWLSALYMSLWSSDNFLKQYQYQ